MQTHQEIIANIKMLISLRKKCGTAFLCFENLLNQLLDEYDKALLDLKELREEAKKETTDWKKALDLFVERFYVHLINRGMRRGCYFKHGITKF